MHVLVQEWDAPDRFYRSISVDGSELNLAIKRMRTEATIEPYESPYWVELDGEHGLALTERLQVEGTVFLTDEERHHI